MVLDESVPICPDLVEHELGHLAGYVGDEPNAREHSIDPFNLMYVGHPNETYFPRLPDRQWCERVAALAR